MFCGQCETWPLGWEIMGSILRVLWELEEFCTITWLYTGGGTVSEAQSYEQVFQVIYPFRKRGPGTPELSMSSEDTARIQICLT